VSTPPPFLRLAGHPVRWRLLRELSRSDQRVGELCALAGERQSLVSYHLRLLRDGGLVTARRSLADGRDTYYVLDLERCGALLADAGAALHPGLAPAAPPQVGADVLFLCTGNSARSQMAEALAQRMSGGAIAAASAGSHPKPLHPDAVRVMRERGIDISARRSKHVSALADRRFDYAITLCDRVREVCPELPGAPVQVHWSIPDPARDAHDAEPSPPAFERTAAELERRIGFLIDTIDAHRAGGEPT
jgi:ArsR family transcriptional regulator, arsenate/arsenite/antimonite-responsive transcriptional repressor / arsenate reductase (thioredoxin)